VATLLVVHHTVSPPLAELLDAVLAGAGDDAVEGVHVVCRAALSATASDVLAADGYLLGTPANLGYMSGALKHFFDTIYYPCLAETVGRPFGYWVHGNNDTTGAQRSVEAVTTGLQWRLVAAPLLITGPVDRETRDAAYELGGTVAATLST
jgi:NAD(P)H-dependent FMN reductase